ncbi:MAG: CpsD/CapB family tyrosine-protein kinase [Acidobacteria bacterium]|nr:CpsD/CapB family tyrosine-protein kinase [Acidobacteriota bacterium]
MSKVFEALQRQLQNERNREPNRDPLAAETGTPDAPAGDEARDDASVNFELPSVIGAPINPQPSFQDTAPSPQTTNGSGRKSFASLPLPRRTQPEFRRGEFQEEPSDTSAPQSDNHHREKIAPARCPQEVPVEQPKISRLHPRLILLTEPNAPECEQYRTLRTELFHAAARKRTQIVTVTSAVANEGKTSTVLNLALAIAQSKERRVLVIEGDLRRPSFASYLGVQPTGGLSEVLEGGSEVFKSMFCLEGLELYALPVISEANNPTELLSSERLDEMLTLLREYFDFILVDSPPVMPFADSRLLANHADAVILVVRAGLAPYETVEKAIDALPRGRILGVVLNGAEHLREAGYYDYYYYYGRREERPRTLGKRIANIFHKKKNRRRD